MEIHVRCNIPMISMMLLTKALATLNEERLKHGQAAEAGILILSELDLTDYHMGEPL